MANYTRNDDETVDLLKQWWAKYGNVLSTAILIIVVAIVALQFWQRHQTKVAGQAAMLYEQMMLDSQKGDHTGAKAQANSLIQEYSSTTYATVASLLLAKQAVDDQQLTQASQHLQWVIDNSKQAFFVALAKLRLADILINQKQAQQALDLIGASQAFFPSYALAVKARAELALNNTAQARKDYQAAMQNLPKNSTMHALFDMQQADL